MSVDLEQWKQKIRNANAEWERRLEAVWTNMNEPFTTSDDVPDIPVWTAERLRNIVYPALERCGAIPKRNLIVGETYYGHCRNASKAVWDGKKFTYERHKFGDTFDEDINHYEDDNGYDVFVPIRIWKEENKN